MDRSLQHIKRPGLVGQEGALLYLKMGGLFRDLQSGIFGSERTHSHLAKTKTTPGASSSTEVDMDRCSRFLERMNIKQKRTLVRLKEKKHIKQNQKKEALLQNLSGNCLAKGNPYKWPLHSQRKYWRHLAKERTEQRNMGLYGKRVKDLTGSVLKIENHPTKQESFWYSSSVGC